MFIFKTFTPKNNTQYIVTALITLYPMPKKKIAPSKNNEKEIFNMKNSINLNTFFGKFNSYTIWKNLEQMPFGNYIIYGPTACGKYTTAINFIRPHSESALRTYKTLNVAFNKKNYYIHMSDIHFEIDMNMLGSSAKMLWVCIFQLICDIVVLRKKRIAYILCKNFNVITNELLDIFQTYVSPNNLMIDKCTIQFILLTDCISFIPTNILSIFTLIRVPIYTQINNVAFDKTSNGLEKNDPLIAFLAMGSNNFTIAKKENKFLPHKYKQTILSNIETIIENYNPDNSIMFRNVLYDVYVYNLNLYDIICPLLFKLITKYESVNTNNNQLHVHDERFHEIIVSVCFYLIESLEMYNVNYRPILHIEKIMIYLVDAINKMKNLKENPIIY